MATRGENIKAGARAVAAGSQDFGLNDTRTDLVDTLTNLMHYAANAGFAFYDALDSAEKHYMDEVSSETF